MKKSTDEGSVPKQNTGPYLTQICEENKCKKVPYYNYYLIGDNNEQKVLHFCCENGLEKFLKDNNLIIQD